MVTLNHWAQSVEVRGRIATDSQRGALLYQHLREHPWFENADTWSMTHELLDLFDELTHALHDFPKDATAFAEAVKCAYQARENIALQLEARLVFELWHAMQSGSELDEARAYQQRLAKLSARADRPLYVLRTSEWDAVEQRFLDEYQRSAPVKVFDLRVMGTRASTPRFFAATSLEQEARSAAMQVRLWLQAGKRNIAIVAQDRVVARRTRALLERSEILVTDETGWTFATLSVSSVLDRLLGAVQSDFYHHDLLDLLKSPYIFADQSATERKGIVHKLEVLLRKQGVTSALDRFDTLAQNVADLHLPLSRLRRASEILGMAKRRTLFEWISALEQSMVVLGIDIGLQQDDAGRQLLQAISTWQQELRADAGLYRFAEWRRWLSHQLDIQTYRDSNVDSEVRFTHLAATRWRQFDAVLLLGCDAEHLPSAADGGRWFNDAVRGSLNLPTLSMQIARQREDLQALLALNNDVLVTWQRDKNGEIRLLSPFLQLLRDEYQITHQNDRAELQLPSYLAAEDAHEALLPGAVRPAPRVPPGMVPDTLSISGYNALVACPYQFYARHILGLNELDEVRETIEKRDYGERVHAVLQKFHDRFPRLSDNDAAELEAALRAISADVFEDLLRDDFTARAWLARWHKSLPEYLAWQLDNETEGWQYAGSEKTFNLKLESVRLKGRIDRLDIRGDDRRVFDYKTQTDSVLRDKLRQPGEDVQLACYAHSEGAVSAAFVSIDNGKIRTVAPNEDVTLLAQLNVARLERVMGCIRNGAGLVANGIDATCEYCEMRGVCRKGEWL
jgi:ATP-dependent helicase/nuclease subunit B